MRHPQPDFDRLRRVLRREGEPDRVPFVELFADREVMEAVLGEPFPPAVPGDRRSREEALRRTIRFWLQLGYDYVEVEAAPPLPSRRLRADDTAALKRAAREWADEWSGVINNWQDFESYPWPRPEDVDYSDLEFVSQHLPDGMKAIFMADGIIEHLKWLMGYVPLSLTLKDDPDLVLAVTQKLEEVVLPLFRTAAQVPEVGALWIGDDMGFKTGTVISPADLRRYVLPFERQVSEVAHAHDLPFILHACGDLHEIMDDLIDDVHIDAKHSFEDVILPVTEAKRVYGDRVALLGGIDVDYLCRHDEQEVRAYVRRTIDLCAPGGGWALGTGNSVANYIPVGNYLAMLDEGWRYGAYGR